MSITRDFDWKPLALVPALALLVLPFIGSPSTWLTLTVAARGLLDPAGGHRLRQQRVAVLARGQPGRAARRHGPVHQRLQLQAGGIRLALGVGAQHARRREHQVRFGGRRRRVGHRAVPASGSIE